MKTVSAFAGTLHLSVIASTTHKGWVGGLHGLALAVLIALALHRPMVWILAPLIGVSAFASWQQAELRTRSSVRRLRWPAEGPWVWQTADKRWHEGQLSDAWMLGTKLAILSLTDDDRPWRRSRCLLFHDSLSTEQHRHLRARLTVMWPSLASSDDA